MVETSGTTPTFISGGNESSGMLGGGLGAGFVGGILGGLLFGDGFGGRRGDRGSNDTDSRVDTLALLQQGHANALQTANQTNEITNRTFEQTLSLQGANFATQREVLQNRFDTSREICGVNHNVDNKGWENRLATAEFRGDVDKKFAETNCHIATSAAQTRADILAFENRALAREKDAEIANLKTAIGEMRTRDLLRAEASRTNGLVYSNFANTNMGLLASGSLTAGTFTPPATIGFPVGLGL
ncbi:MAG: hypothetical protein FWD76_02100 [Firmicutes bacterium]|nr:hypothetical protein [Bacillota bacterium]